MSRPQEIRDEELEQRVFSALGESLTPAALPPDLHARLRHRILQAAAPAPEGTTTWRLRDAGWFSPAPHVEMKQLRLDEAAGTQEMLIRLAPGVRVPEHSHRKEEQMIILEGECHVGDHLLKQGDVHVAPPGSWHPAITTQRGVLLLLRCEHPLPAG
jgi:quercetin dioxygenase-like cupin family protein